MGFGYFGWFLGGLAGFSLVWLVSNFSNNGTKIYIFIYVSICFLITKF